MPRLVPAVRACTRCGSTANEFGKCSKVSDGKASTCKACQREVFRLKYASDERLRLRSKQSAADWARANPGASRAKVRKYQASNPEAVRASQRRYRDANRSAVYAKNAVRAYAQKKAVPGWANRQAMREIYRHAKQLTKETGTKFVVDHVVPLRGEFVCGLHVETNLQIMSAEANLRKSNRYDTEI